MTVNLNNAMTAQKFEHVSNKNNDGTPVRARRNGKTKRWVTRPEEFRIPVKYGLKICFYIDEMNGKDWNVVL